MGIDVNGLLKAVSPEAPCGTDISYDAAYLELERMAQGTPESEKQKGEEPNWKNLRDRCLELMERSKNLRVILYLTLSSLRLEGIPGLRDGLALLRGTLDQYWDDLYPRLDPEDNRDPLERINIILSLSPPPETYQDPMRFRDALLDAPLCSSGKAGRFGLRDVLIATGEFPKPEEQDVKVADQALIDAAFEDSEIAYVQNIDMAITDALSHLQGIESSLDQRVGVGKAPALKPFGRLLEQCRRQVRKCLERRGYGDGLPSAGADAPAADGTVAAVAKGFSGGIGSVQDVVKAFDAICAYYDKSEPSSPVPLLVKRARRLVGKCFVDIIRDLSPEALAQVEMLGGKREKEETTPGQ